MTRSDDRVACALASPSEEDRAKYSDAVAYHQVHETLGECDTWVCRCGNQGRLDGFYPCDVEGDEREVTDRVNLNQPDKVHASQNRGGGFGATA